MVTNKGGQCRNYKMGHVPLRKVEGTGSTETQHILNSIFKTDPSCMHNSTLISQEVHIDQIALYSHASVHVSSCSSHTFIGEVSLLKERKRNTTD